MNLELHVQSQSYTHLFIVATVTLSFGPSCSLGHAAHPASAAPRPGLGAAVACSRRGLDSEGGREKQNAALDRREHDRHWLRDSQAWQGGKMMK